MKLPIPAIALKTKTFFLAAACAFALGANSSQAALTFTLAQVGTDVVLTGSGSANLTDLNLVSTEPAAGGGIFPIFGVFLGGSGGADVYEALAPIRIFGPGSDPTLATLNSGSPLGISLNFGSVTAQLIVPQGYISGDPIVGSESVFGTTDLATIGATVGTYTWTWGTGLNADSATLIVIPEPSSLALLALGATGLLARRRRNAA